MRLDIEKDIRMLNNIDVYSMEENVFVKIGRFLKGLLDKFINFCKMIINKIKGLFNKGKEKVETEIIKKKTEEVVKKAEENPEKVHILRTPVDFNSPPFSNTGIIKEWDIDPKWKEHFEFIGNGIKKTIRIMLSDAKATFQGLESLSNKIAKIHTKETETQENEYDLKRIKHGEVYMEKYNVLIEKHIEKYEYNFYTGQKRTFESFVLDEIRCIQTKTKIRIEELYRKTADLYTKEPIQNPTYESVLIHFLLVYNTFISDPEGLNKFLDKVFPWDVTKPVNRRREIDSHFDESEKKDSSIDFFAEEFERYIKYSNTLAKELSRSLLAYQYDISDEADKRRGLRYGLPEEELREERILVQDTVNKFTRLIGVLTKIGGWGFQLLGIRKSFQNMYKEAINIVLNEALRQM